MNPRTDLKGIPSTILLLAVLLWAPAPAGAAPQEPGEGRPLTLEEALRMAEDQNPRLRAARQQVEAAEGAVWGAAGRMLPTASFSGSWNFAEKVQVIPNPFPTPGGPEEFEIDFTQDYNGSVNLSLPVWTWGANRSAYGEARTAVDASREDLEAARQETRLQVKQAFYGVLLARRGVEVAEATLAQARRQEESTARKVREGAASEFDLLRARVQVANMRPAVSRARSGLNQARTSLFLVLGLEPDAKYEPVGEMRYRPVDSEIEALKREARANRSDLQAARLGTQRAQLALNMAKASWKPALFVQGNYGFRADNVMLDRRFNDNYAANLVVSFPLFDGFSTKSRIAQAEAGREQARIGVEQMEMAVAAEVERAWLDLRTFEEACLAQQDNVTQAERAVEIAQVSFENGLVTGLELMDSQVALAAARQNHYQSLYDYLVAAARLERAVGRPIMP
ncbi:MAG: TolC family protein [bacterium]